MTGTRLDGRSALISGGGGGCGAAASRLFAAEGAAVTIVDRQEEAGLALAEEIRGRGGRAVSVRADVAVRAEVEAAVTLATERHGAPTVLFSTMPAFWPSRSPSSKKPRRTSGTG